MYERIQKCSVISKFTLCQVYECFKAIVDFIIQVLKIYFIINTQIYKTPRKIVHPENSLHFYFCRGALSCSGLKNTSAWEITGTPDFQELCLQATATGAMYCLVGLLSGKFQIQTILSETFLFLLKMELIWLQVVDKIVLLCRVDFVPNY